MDIIKGKFDLKDEVIRTKTQLIAILEKENKYLEKEIERLKIELAQLPKQTFSNPNISKKGKIIQIR